LSTLYICAEKQINISDLLLKVQEPAIIHDLGEKGFAIHDIGEEKIKFFNWDAKLINEMKINKGEGPGEFKYFITSAFFFDEHLYLLGFMENKINIYDIDGKFVKSIKLEFITKEVIYLKNKLYVFNLRMNASAASFTLGNIIDPKTFKTNKKIIMKDRIVSPKTLGGNPALLGLSSTFDVGINGNIFILISSENVLIELNEDGELISRTDMPYKERKEIKSVKNGDKVETVMSVLDWYQDMRVFKNSAYACFLKHVKKDKYGGDVYQTYVIKILKYQKYNEKILDGNFVFIGEYKENVFFFNTEKYQIVSIKLNEW
jgi:hypothetical protein